eukprot:g1308.t1
MLHKQKRAETVVERVCAAADRNAETSLALEFAAFCHRRKPMQRHGGSSTSLHVDADFVRRTRSRAIARATNEYIRRSDSNVGGKKSNGEEKKMTRTHLEILCHQILLLESSKGSGCGKDNATLASYLVDAIVSNQNDDAWFAADAVVLHRVAAAHFRVAAAYVHALLRHATEILAKPRHMDKRDTVRRRVVDVKAIAHRFCLLLGRSEGEERRASQSPLSRFSAMSLRQWEGLNPSQHSILLRLVESSAGGRLDTRIA